VEKRKSEKRKSKNPKIRKRKKEELCVAAYSPAARHRPTKSLLEAK
jgi:hypothetical protein